MTIIETPPAVARASLATRRLRLRFPVAADAPALALHANDPDVARNTTGIPIPYTLEQAQAFVARACFGDPAHEALFAVCRAGGAEDGGAKTAETTEVIGLLGFHANEEDDLEVGYWLGRPFWGRGYMTEALCAAMAWAGGPWRRRYVVSGHFDDNPASGAVLIKAGFLPTGETRWRFSLARGETARTRMMIWLA